jgi:transposase
MSQEIRKCSAPPPSAVPLVEPEIIREIRGLGRLGWGSKRIARELGIARNTARRYLHHDSAGDIVQVRPRGRRLDAALVREAERLLAQEAEGNAVVVHRLLTASGGVSASVRTVQRVVAPQRASLRSSQLASVRFETAPGKQMQIDFGEKRVCVGGVKTRLYFFVAVLGYSRRIFVRTFVSQRHDDWREGIVAAFEHFGGVPETLLIDNPKAMVLEHNVVSRQVTLHPAFAAFCVDWGIEARACAPYRARTKGKTESGVKYVKRNALAGLSFVNMAALEAHLAGWMQLADARVHGTTHERPSERFEQSERTVLRPLPQRPTPARERRLRRRVANDSLVNVDTVRYSVPHRYVGDYVDVHVSRAEVHIYAGAQRIATHRRSNEPHASITQGEHYDGLLRRHRAPEQTVEPSTLTDMGRSLQEYADAIGGAP